MEDSVSPISQFLINIFSGLTTKDYITFGFSFLALVVGMGGLILGCYNAWKAHDKDKVKLSVVPMAALIFPQAYEMLSLNITNLSVFPVTVDDIGFFLCGTTKRISIQQPIMRDGGTFPRKLESRTSFSIFWDFQKDSNRAKFSSIQCAYAKTACGLTFKGTSPALQDLLNISKN